METSEAPYVYETHPEYSVLALYPLINDGNWSNVSQVGSEILERLDHIPSPVLIVDLSPVDYMGSAQVALIVRIWKSLKKTNGRMVVQCPGQMVREVLTIAGLEKVWVIVNTRELALEHLGVRTGGSKPSPAFPILALLAAAGAAVGLALTLGDIQPLTGIWIVFGCTAASLITGILTAVQQQGVWRWVGVGVVVAGLAMSAIAAGELNTMQGGPPAGAVVNLPPPIA